MTLEILNRRIPFSLIETKSAKFNPELNINKLQYYVALGAILQITNKKKSNLVLFFSRVKIGHFAISFHKNYNCNETNLKALAHSK